jgi:hypothetical protein
LQENVPTRTHNYSDAIKQGGTVMTAIAKALSNAFPTLSTDVDSLRTIALFCGVGLLASLVLVATGLSFLPADSQALNVINWI